jgi:hypothetical protein
MTQTERSSRALFAIAFFSLWYSLSTPSWGQVYPGYNAVCTSQTGCSTNTGTSAFVDASMFLPPIGNRADICDAIYYVFTRTVPQYPANGEVIDARGITGSALTCTQGSPWSENNVYIKKPSVILLPAGIITTSASWVLPQNTKLIGTAKGTGNIGTTNYAFETTIQASANFSGAVVQFGDPSHCSSGCQGISVEHLTISGNGGAGYTMNGL